MITATRKYWKFQGRAFLTRMGLWERVESWRLQKRFRKGFIHEADFNFFRHFQEGGLFVDIGANIGQSALSVRAANPICPILSFEPNPDMEFGLRRVKRLLGDSFHFHMHGFGAKTETKCLYVPLVKGIPFSQFATFRREGLSENPGLQQFFYQGTGTERFLIEERSLKIVRFDELSLNPKFVKIDVEGTELDVLAGMEETLARCRPLLMTEGNFSQDFLWERDYQMFLHLPETNTIRSASRGEVGLNFFFIPQEKVAHLEKQGLIQTSPASKPT